MVDAVTTVGGVGTVAPVVQQTVSTSAAATTSAAVAASLTNHLFAEPITGVLVTEQLDGNGLVVSQTPANFVLAYLRNGLTADGEPKVLASA